MSKQENPSSTVWKDKVDSEITEGAIVQPKKKIEFSDGSCHFPQFVYYVQEDEVFYFRIMKEDYTVIQY